MGLKNRRITSLSLLLAAASQVGFSAGFEDGSKYQVKTLKGWATAVCTGNSRSYYCSDDDWGPSTHSIFLAEKGNQAVRAFLKSTHADGNSTNKSVEYDADKGKSRSTVNLLISSLTQVPLLKPGKNQVEYELKNAQSAVVTKGSFEVVVESLGDVECRDASVFINSNDCDSSSIVCREYFWQVRDTCSVLPQTK